MMKKQRCREVTEKRLLIIVFGLLLCSFGFPGSLSADQWKLSEAIPPTETDALYRVPDPNGLVSIVIDSGSQPAVGTTTVSLNPFWDSHGTRYDFKLLGPKLNKDGKTVQVNPGQPILLETGRIPDEQPVWGTLLAKNGGEQDHLLALVLGKFGPTVKIADQGSISPSGLGLLTVDISQHRAFGNEIEFKISELQTDGEPVKVSFVNASDKDIPYTQTVSIPKAKNSLSLQVDARYLVPGKTYTGSLQTAIATHRFIDTEFKLRRQTWQTVASFAPVTAVSGEGPLRLILSTAGEQPIAGVSVTSDTPSSDEFDPRNDLDIVMHSESGDISLWQLDSSSADQVALRTLQPRDHFEILLKEKKQLAAGIYPVELEFQGLNVGQAGRVKVTATFVKSNSQFWAVLILVIAVLFSYITSKGLATSLRRRNLRNRIHAIRSTSWLRRDRWGALPVVRAFGRITRADRALKQKHGMRWLFRVVTTPELIASEVTEVEKRLKVLERLNRLAIYWKASPAASGLQVSGVDPMIVRRAQKILRRIINRLSQLQNEEEITTLITGEIEGLEAWTQRDHMEAGYWASLRGDMNQLLDALQIDAFSFDDKTCAELQRRLDDILKKSSASNIKQALKQAIAACQSAPSNGSLAVREALSPVFEKLQNATEIEALLNTIASSDREVVRRLHEVIVSMDTPGTLNAMIRLEGTYAMLKLIWEHRCVDPWREQFILFAQEDKPLTLAFDWIDGEVWKLLKQDSIVQIIPPDEGRTIEEYEPIDLKLACTNPAADTFLFKHGIEYLWKIDFGGLQKLQPITRSTTVTQFIPRAGTVKVDVTMCYKNKTHELQGVSFETIETTQFQHLWPVPTTELIGIGFAFVLALIAGFQSEAFNEALTGSWKQYLALFAWGIAADQTRNLLQNMDKLTIGEDAPSN